MKKTLKILFVFLLLAGAVLCGIAMAAEIHDIDMETGDKSQWDANSDADSDVQATAGSALAGTNYGLDFRIDDANNAYQQMTQADTGTGDFRLRFYIDPNSLTMAAWDEFELCSWYTNPSPYFVFKIRLQYNGSSQYVLIFTDYNDAGPLNNTSVAIGDEPNYAEVHIHQAADANTPDGTTQFLVGGVSKYTRSSEDNYDIFNQASVWRAGIVQGADAGTSGAFFMDQFYTTDDAAEIGAYTPPAAASGGSKPRIMNYYKRLRSN